MINRIDDLTGKVIGLAMKVHRFFGPGYLEEVYKNALMVELERAGIEAQKEVSMSIVNPVNLVNPVERE